MQRIYPPPAADVDIAVVYDQLDWPSGDALPSDRPFIALNMVSSADGRVALDGSARGIGSAADHVLLTRLRTHPDALLFGAGTLRADRVGKGVPASLQPARIGRGLAPQPLLVALTASGDLPLERAVFAAPTRVVVFVAARTPAEAVARLSARAMVRVAGEERPDPSTAMSLLRREFGVRHVLCEGGPTLNGALLAASLLDELFLTLAPTLLGAGELSLVAGPPLRPSAALALRSIYEHEGELYLRYQVERR